MGKIKLSFNALKCPPSVYQNMFVVLLLSSIIQSVCSDLWTLHQILPLILMAICVSSASTLKSKCWVGTGNCQKNIPMYRVPFLHKIAHTYVCSIKRCMGLGIFPFLCMRCEVSMLYIFIYVKIKPVEQVGCTPRCVLEG